MIEWIPYVNMRSQNSGSELYSWVCAGWTLHVPQDTYYYAALECRQSTWVYVCFEW